jgi:hypothetical protein
VSQPRRGRDLNPTPPSTPVTPGLALFGLRLRLCRQCGRCELRARLLGNCRTLAGFWQRRNRTGFWHGGHKSQARDERWIERSNRIARRGEDERRKTRWQSEVSRRRGKAQTNGPRLAGSIFGVQFPPILEPVLGHANTPPNCALRQERRAAGQSPSWPLPLFQAIAGCKADNGATSRSMVRAVS